MTSQRTTIFKTESLDLAAYLATAGYEPSISPPHTGYRATFSFEVSEGLHGAIIAYEQGEALPAKKLLNKRSWLFREASRVVREVAR